jgi:hypothetical protein
MIETRNGFSPSCFPFRSSCILIFLFVALLLFVSEGVLFGIAQGLLGDTSVERTQDWDSGGLAEAFQVTASDTGTPGSLTLYPDNLLSAKQLIACLYANASGNPRALLTRGNTTTLKPGAWNTLAVPSFKVGTGASDWITILGAGGTWTRCALCAYRLLVTPSSGRGTFHAISGVITPAAGGSGATVSLAGLASATTTADGSGNYSFGGLANGRYAITPSNGGYSFSPASQAVAINDADVKDVNFTATAVHPTYTISGTISPASAGAGATITLSGAVSLTTIADASGNYSFSGLSNGSYTVKPTRHKATFSPASQTVTINDADVTGVNFTAMTRGSE